MKREDTKIWRGTLPEKESLDPQKEAKATATLHLEATATLTIFQGKDLPPEAFFTLLYGKEAPGYLTLFIKPDNRAFHIPATTLREAAHLALSLSKDGRDVYFGVGLRRENLGERQRGGNEDVIILPGLWADLDIQGPSHKKRDLPLSEEEILQFLDQVFPLKPSIVVFSGYGLHVYWLFKEPLLLETPSDRERAEELLRKFQNGLLQLAKKEKGWDFDRTHDLSRILRVPGTFNFKDREAPALVRVIGVDPNARYTSADIDYFFGDVDASDPESPPLNGKYCLEKVFREGVEEGRRNNTAFVLACHLRTAGISQGKAEEYLSDWNKRNRPPLSESELGEVIASAFKKDPPYDPGCKSYQDAIGVDTRICQSECRWRNTRPAKAFPLMDWTRIKYVRLTPEGIAELEGEGEILKYGAFPTFPLEAAEGVLGVFARWASENTEIPPSYAYACLRNLLGLSMGRIIGVNYGNVAHFPIFYDALIGPTAFARKGTAINLALEIVEEAFMQAETKKPFVVVPGVGSAEGLLDRLAGAKKMTPEGAPLALLRLDELALLTDKAQQKATRGLLSLLNNLWDLPKLIELPTRQDPVTVEEPTLSILAGSALPNLENIGTREIEGGFANRFCWSLPNPQRKLVPFPSEMPAQMKREIAQEFLIAIERAKKLGLKQKFLPLNGDAKGIWEEFYTEFRARIGENSPKSAFLARIPEQIFREAITITVLQGKNEVDREVLEKSIMLGEYRIQAALYVASGLQEDASLRLTRRILFLLDTAGGEEKTLAKRELMQKCSGYYKHLDEFYRTLYQLAQYGHVELLEASI